MAWVGSQNWQGGRLSLLILFFLHGSAGSNFPQFEGPFECPGDGLFADPDNYAEGSSQWEGFPIKVDVPKTQILLGSKGSAGSSTIDTLAKETVSQGLLGIMVWFCSVRDGLVYGSGWDCSDSTDSQDGYLQALTYFNQHMQTDV